MQSSTNRELDVTDFGSDGEAWSRLDLYLSRDVMERRYRARHGVDLEPGKAGEIIAHLDQARQYFRSAESAGALAGPLEQYYGALAFARAIILFRMPQMSEATLDRHHGLSASIPAEGAPEDIIIKVREGTFDQLLLATGNVEPCSVDLHLPGHGTKHSRAMRSLPRPPRKATFRFVDLLARIPHLRAHFEEAFQRRAHCFGGRASYLLGTLSVTVWRGLFDLPAPEEFRDAMGMAPFWTAEITSTGAIQFSHRSADGEALHADLPNVVEHPNLAHSIAEPFPGEERWHLSQLCAYYAASHAMSMLVRYHPSRWSSLVSHKEGDRLMPVLERMRALIQSDFVRLVLWELDRSDPGRPGPEIGRLR